MDTPTYNVDIVLARKTAPTDCTTMNYSHNKNGIQSASSATMALADYDSEDASLPIEYQTVLVAVNVTVHDVRICRFCKDA